MSLCHEVFWCGQACSDEPGLQAGDGAVLEDQLAAVAHDLLGRSVVQGQAPEVLDYRAVRAQHLLQGAPDGPVRADLVAGDQGAAIQPVRLLVTPEVPKGDGRRLLRLHLRWLRLGWLLGRGLRRG